MESELEGPRLVVSEPTYPTMKSKPSLASVSSASSSFAVVTLRSLHLILSSCFRLSVEIVPFISPWPLPAFVSAATGSDWVERSRGFMSWLAWLLSCIWLIGTDELRSTSYHDIPLIFLT